MVRHSKRSSLSLAAISFILINFLLLWGPEVRSNQLSVHHFFASTAGDTVRPLQLDRNLSTSVAKSVIMPDDRSDGGNKERINDEISSSSTVTTESQDEPLRRTPKYSSESIARTIHALVYVPGSLVIYNPVNDTLLVYAVSHSNMPSTRICRRCRTYVPILARSLWANPRVSPHHAPLQLFFSEADFPYIDMQLIRTTRNDTNTSEANSNGFCPWVQFGSVFRDSTILPNVHAFPFAQFLWCMEEWIQYQQSQTGISSVADLAGNTSDPDRRCKAWRLPLRAQRWRTLIPKIIWRGSDYACLHTLRHEDFRSPYTVSEVPFFPRRQAVNMSANGETWIDASISASGSSPTGMHNFALANYKYQVDFAGAGGTTWTGTLEKLAMPGLLFHHETPAKDWFHDSLEAWQHYVPIRTDLSDLKEQYRWAEENQKKAQAIARRGTAFAKSILSYSNVQKVFETYFGQSGVLSKIVDAYENPDYATVESILSDYRDKWNLTVHLVSICTRLHCDTRYTHDNFWRVSLQDYSCDRHAYQGRRSVFGQNMSQCVA